MQPQGILELYKSCSVQMINKAKSVVMFSKNTKSERKKEVCDSLHVEKETMNEIY